MRLLQLQGNCEFSLVEHIGSSIPRYAILSHTWGADHEEVTFKDLTKGRGKSKPGYRKLTFCGERAAKDNLRWFWVDTCCIKKSSDAELSESINSMFRWYQNAAKCYVYLSDVSTDQDDIQHSQPQWEDAFRRSRWFTRGWTLQELIAPRSVEFFCSNSRRLGDKEDLAQQIHEITGIPLAALRGAELSEFDVNERMLWAQGRETKRPEDMAYSLLGIFGIHIPLIYGEGMHNAFNRLQWELDRRTSGKQSDLSGNPILHPHPVKRNYRKVIVVIISWECDRLEMTVQHIANVFRDVYHYEVRETLLTLEERHRGDPHWPWPDTSDVKETDLQIIYYLGSTRRVSDPRGWMDVQATPFQTLP
ncbi:HET-domain-containing protein [Lentithecium fluviatile CBS 122367]|uniref:HET-domain-containing protein n=1 Tax=Lentithecium fluviatile CBS 122367 TaxID=1168545 RepID=A0A6G1IF73_9PLEO|nr:HET-domain-containing protein [Lentithecium fluviatile CBS 122367]